MLLYVIRILGVFINNATRGRNSNVDHIVCWKKNLALEKCIFWLVKLWNNLVYIVVILATTFWYNIIIYASIFKKVSFTYEKYHRILNNKFGSHCIKWCHKCEEVGSFYNPTFSWYSFLGLILCIFNLQGIHYDSSFYMRILH